MYCIASVYQLNTIPVFPWTDISVLHCPVRCSIERFNLSLEISIWAQNTKVLTLLSYCSFNLSLKIQKFWLYYRIARCVLYWVLLNIVLRKVLTLLLSVHCFVSTQASWTWSAKISTPDGTVPNIKASWYSMIIYTNMNIQCHCMYVYLNSRIYHFFCILLASKPHHL